VSYRSRTARLAAVLGAAALTFAVAAPATARATAGTAQSIASGRAQAVLLINGDRLLWRPGVTSTLFRINGSGPVLSLGHGARTIYLPEDALPYLGRGLAPGLFSPASLSRAESGGRLRVEIAFTGRRPRLPGVTITGWAHGTARGYLDPRVFGAALARQFRADHGRASYGTDGMFAGGVSIAPAGASPVRASRARPDYPMHELTVTGTNEAGRPDTGDPVFVINAANWHTFGDPVETNNVFYHGTARYSVPGGTYWAFAWFYGTGKSADTLRMDVLPQFTVTGRHTQVRMSARAATSELEAVTPRPSALRGFAFEVTRGGRDHTASGAGALGFAGDKLWVNTTTARPTVGTLSVAAGESSFSPAGAAGAPYDYDLVFTGPAGIIPSLRWKVPAASLATTTERFYQEVPGNGQVYGLSASPDLGAAVGVPQTTRMPGTEIQYMTARPNVVYVVGNNEFSTGYGGGQDDAYHTVRPGQQLTENWDQDPLHPQPMTQPLTGELGRLFAPIPAAYRAGNKLWLSPTVFSDNTPGHYGYGYTNFPKSGVKVSGRYAVYQNGVLIAHGNPANQNLSGIPPVTLSAKPATIRFVLNATRHGARFPLSPVSQTAWTWRSAPEPGATLPSNWSCLATGNRCAVQAMMSLNYQIHGLGLNEATAAGRQVIGLTVGHIEPGAPVKVTGAKVQFSLDGGHTWQPATVTAAGPGQFTVSFTAPAGAEVSLRTSATDAAGGSITETVQDAYRA
jgi:hypothetical protein